MSYEFTAPVKDPQAVQDHGMDWSDWLDEGETIVQRTVVATSADLVISNITDAAGVVQWRVSGGIGGRNYIATCSITTSAGRKEDRSLRYRVEQR